ncbi:MAG: ImmA/IrrE family metallo-endopeptidase [Oscillibacter sp.]|nr:ImmA/IrrE family metallo-endopeptidase [Oscillibacter sp.]
MTYADICDKVEKLKRKFNESDPFQLCGDMGIILLRQHLGTDPDCVKGFFLEKKRIKLITVNEDLPLVIQRIIVAHELGHAALHRNTGVYAFHDVALYDATSIYEKEANLFAAEYLLDDDEVLEALNRDSTFFAAAAELMVPAELLDFKFRMMKWRGYKITESPITAQSSFLRGMEIPVNTDDCDC